MINRTAERQLSNMIISLMLCWEGGHCMLWSIRRATISRTKFWPAVRNSMALRWRKGEEFQLFVGISHEKDNLWQNRNKENCRMKHQQIVWLYFLFFELLSTLRLHYRDGYSHASIDSSPVTSNTWLCSQRIRKYFMNCWENSLVFFVLSIECVAKLC